MKVLAINTAGTNTEVGLINGEQKVWVRDENGRRASESLMPLVDEVLSDAKLNLDDLDAFAVVVGPGSFTGIRIGVSAVRAFAYATNKPVIAVNLLEVLAYNREAGVETVAVCDAGNGYCYTARFSSSGEPLDLPQCVPSDAAKQIVDACGCAVATDTKYSALGDCGLRFGLLDAVERHAEQTVKYNEVVPLYIRPCQAESVCK